MENNKQQDSEFKIQISAIEKSYNHVLEVVSNNPLTIED